MGVVVAVDVDGTLSPIHPLAPGPWTDDNVVGNVFGPVQMSPSLARHLDGLAAVPGVHCVWLTSWSADMRSAMREFPGRSWPALTPGLRAPSSRTWWKLIALERWVQRYNQTADAEARTRIGSVAWLDDDLRHGARRAACQRRFDQLGVDLLMIAPRTAVGVTPLEMVEVGEWVKRRVAKPDRHLLDRPWRTSPVAPCGCAWDGLHCPHCMMVTAPTGDAWHPAHTIRCHRVALAARAGRGSAAGGERQH